MKFEGHLWHQKDCFFYIRATTSHSRERGGKAQIKKIKWYKGSSGSLFQKSQKDFFNEIFCNPLSQRCEGWEGFKNLKVHKGSSSLFERSRKDLSNDSLCDPSSQGCKDESGSKILKDVRAQIKKISKRTLE